MTRYKSEEEPQLQPLFLILELNEQDLEDSVALELAANHGDLLTYDKNDVYKTMYDLLDETEQMIEATYLAGGVTRVKLHIDNLNRSLAAAVAEGSCITNENYNIGTWYFAIVKAMKDSMEVKQLEPGITPAA